MHTKQIRPQKVFTSNYTRISSEIRVFKYVVVILSICDSEHFYSCIYDHFRDFDPHPIKIAKIS